MTQLTDFSASLPLHPATPTPVMPESEPAKTLSEKLARLERENAALLARAEDAERGWHDLLAARGYQGPVERNTHEVLISLAQLAEEQLGVLKHLDARAAAGESRSSAAVKTSTRGVDLEVKSYDDGLLQGALDDAIEGYRRGQLKLATLQANGWHDTLAAVEAAKAAGQ